MTLLESLHESVRNAPESGIVEVANFGRARPGTVPLWVGEGDMPTPAFICEAATRSLAAGETFYTAQRGIMDLREALSRYNSALYNRDLSPERFFVTMSGMHALQMAVSAVAGAGDEVIILEPAWPNTPVCVSIRGAVPVMVPLAHGREGWSLYMERLKGAITPKTRALFINTPANPTGWTATRDDLRAILALARQHGLWIIADEIYTRFYWRGDGPRAPSFHDVREEKDKLLFVNTFSKNWAMTGWRIGWLEAPPELGQVIENLVQFSTSGVPVFLQRAAIAALDRGGSFLDHQVQKARLGLDATMNALSGINRLQLMRPDGAFYLFFGIEGLTDSRAMAKSLIESCGVGVAPGSAFGERGEGFMRLCFLRSQDGLAEAAGKLGQALSAL